MLVCLRGSRLEPSTKLSWLCKRGTMQTRLGPQKYAVVALLLL